MTIGSVEPSLGPDILRLSPHLGVPFVARKLRSPRLLWLNERFWLERGIDVLSDDVRASVHRWILDEWAWLIPEPNILDFLGKEERVFFADRYGSSGGNVQGGSGRCGVRGRMNVKGIGATPLVGTPQVVEISHRHGCAWIEEAVREVIDAELAQAEYPHGAVPVVAVIDTGIARYVEEWRCYSRRALILRPNFLRLAHMQRSVYFGTAGETGSDQYLDALRTADMTRRIWGSRHAEGPAVVRSRCSTLAQSILAICDQVAFGRLHRLTQGAVSSSNLTVDGAIVDYGGFTSVQNWCRTHISESQPPFGEEWTYVRDMVRSLTFFQRKYLQQVEDGEQILHDAKERLASTFARHVSRFVFQADRPDGDMEEVVAVFVAYFEAQQMRLDVLTRKGTHDWWYGDLLRFRGSPGARKPDGFAGALVDAVQVYAARKRLDDHQFDALWSRVINLITPRPQLVPHRLTAKIMHLVGRTPANQVARMIEARVDAIVSKSRRVWPHCPEHAVLLGQCANTYSDAIVLRDGRTDQYEVRLRGTALGPSLCIFGTKLPRAAVEPFRLAGYDRTVIAVADPTLDGVMTKIAVEFGITLPPVRYYPGRGPSRSDWLSFMRP